MPYVILSILIQVAFVVHIIKTGRNTIWIWIVIILPMAGSIAYLLIEVIPDLLHTRSGRQAGRKIRSIVNPNQGLNQAASNYSVSDTVENSMRLAEECLEKGLYQEAKDLYSKCLKGIHADEPVIMYGVARCDFALDNYQQSKDMLDKLIELNPEYKNQNAHLLYARSLEKIGDLISAQHEYDTLHSYFNGPEANYYYALYLKSQNRADEAKTILLEIVEKSKISGKHYNNLYKDFIKGARNELYG